MPSLLHLLTFSLTASIRSLSHTLTHALTPSTVSRPHSFHCLTPSLLPLSYTLTHTLTPFTASHPHSFHRLTPLLLSLSHTLTHALTPSTISPPHSFHCLTPSLVPSLVSHPHSFHHLTLSLTPSLIPPSRTLTAPSFSLLNFPTFSLTLLIIPSHHLTPVHYLLSLSNRTLKPPLLNSYTPSLARVTPTHILLSFPHHTGLHRELPPVPQALWHCQQTRCRGERAQSTGIQPLHHGRVRDRAGHCHGLRSQWSDEGMRRVMCEVVRR